MLVVLIRGFLLYYSEKIKHAVSIKGGYREVLSHKGSEHN